MSSFNSPIKATIIATKLAITPITMNARTARSQSRKKEETKLQSFRHVIGEEKFLQV